MYIGGSIFLLAIGAILAFAIEDSVNGIDIPAVGFILMAAGALGIVLSLVIANQSNQHGRDVPPPR